MSAFASLSLLDRNAAAVVFSPQSINADGVARWHDNNAVLDAKRNVTMQLQLPKPGGAVSRLKLKVAVPIMDPVDTSKKIGENFINVEAVFPKNSTDAQRLDMRRFAAELLSHATVVAAFSTLENVY